jgi:hypothetical protein
METSKFNTREPLPSLAAPSFNVDLADEASEYFTTPTIAPLDLEACGLMLF